MTKFNKFYKEFLKLFKKIYFTPKTIKKKPILFFQQMILN